MRRSVFLDFTPLSVSLLASLLGVVPASLSHFTGRETEVPKLPTATGPLKSRLQNWAGSPRDLRDFLLPPRGSQPAASDPRASERRVWKRDVLTKGCEQMEPIMHRVRTCTTRFQKCSAGAVMAQVQTGTNPFQSVAEFRADLVVGHSLSQRILKVK